MEALFESLGLKQDVAQIMLVGTLMALRCVVLVTLTPFLGGKLVPAETRVGLSLALTVLCYPYAESVLGGPVDVNPIVYIALMMKELFIGYLIGFLSTKLFYAMEMGGRMLDVARGASQSEVQVPELQLRASPLGDFNFHLLLIIFISLNGYGFFIEGVVESFRIVPVDQWPRVTLGFEEMVEAIMRYSSSLFGVSFALVFPGLFATFMTDVVFGMFNRIAPHLHSYFMAMGVKALAGLAMFMFSLSLMMGTIAERLEDSLIFVRKIVERLG